MQLYEVNQEGAVLPVGEIDSIGRGCNVEDVERVSDELSAGLEADVLTPMKQWLFAWSTVQGRLKDLTDKRVEMDSRRRQVANLRRKEEYAKSKVDTASNASVRLKKEQDLEKIWHIQQHKVSDTPILFPIHCSERFLGWQACCSSSFVRVYGVGSLGRTSRTYQRCSMP